mmetsp:Transcript_23666/g.89852  ORF Transcript_23666/g.89852 Transcript_23666/m.89852 type:complete len:370 (-) Transcript_23666:18971-20080(-)
MGRSRRLGLRSCCGRTPRSSSGRSSQGQRSGVSGLAGTSFSFGLLGPLAHSGADLLESAFALGSARTNASPRLSRPKARAVARPERRGRCLLSFDALHLGVAAPRGESQLLLEGAENLGHAGKVFSEPRPPFLGHGGGIVLFFAVQLVGHLKHRAPLLSHLPVPGRIDKASAERRSASWLNGDDDIVQENARHVQQGKADDHQGGPRQNLPLQVVELVVEPPRLEAHPCQGDEDRSAEQRPFKVVVVQDARVDQLAELHGGGLPAPLLESRHAADAARSKGRHRAGRGAAAGKDCLADRIRCLAGFIRSKGVVELVSKTAKRFGDDGRSSLALCSRYFRPPRLTAVPVCHNQLPVPGTHVRPRLHLRGV